MEKEHVKIFSGTSIIVRGLQNILDDNKIECYVKNNVESARLSGFGTQQNDVHLFVFKTDLDEALSLANNYEKKISL